MKQKADGERYLDDSGEKHHLRVPLTGWEVYNGEWSLPGRGPISDLVPEATAVLPLRQQKLRDALCAGALFAVASLQMTDTATDAYFASLAQRRANARIFFFAVLCILMPLPLKFFLNFVHVTFIAIRKCIGGFCKLIIVFSDAYCSINNFLII